MPRVDALYRGDQTCAGPSLGARAAWRHRLRSSAVSSLVGEHHHAASDPVTLRGAAAIVRGRFAYGFASKDLEDEEVALWLELAPCSGRWLEVDRARTDGDGRVAFAVPAALTPDVGTYRFELVVRGDQSRARGTVHVVDANTPAVVFDIDGTLTSSDAQLVAQIVLGREPQMRPGASSVARLYARAGYLPVYVSGRPYLLRASTRAWLRHHRFPPGVLVTTDRVADSRPGADHVGRFKRDRLLALLGGPRLSIARAYGNAVTDICAYAAAGVAPDATFIIGDHGGQACDGLAPTRAIRDFRAHYAQVAAFVTRAP